MARVLGRPHGQVSLKILSLSMPFLVQCSWDINRDRNSYLSSTWLAGLQRYCILNMISRIPSLESNNFALICHNSIERYHTVTKGLDYMNDGIPHRPQWRPLWAPRLEFVEKQNKSVARDLQYFWSSQLICLAVGGQNEFRWQQEEVCGEAEDVEMRCWRWFITFHVFTFSSA